MQPNLIVNVSEAAYPEPPSVIVTVETELDETTTVAKAPLPLEDPKRAMFVKVPSTRSAESVTEIPFANISLSFKLPDTEDISSAAKAEVVASDPPEAAEPPKPLLQVPALLLPPLAEVPQSPLVFESH